MYINILKRFDDNEISGQNSISFSTAEFPSGISFCNLNTGINKIANGFVVMR